MSGIHGALPSNEMDVDIIIITVHSDYLEARCLQNLENKWMLHQKISWTMILCKQTHKLNFLIEDKNFEKTVDES